MIHEIELNNLPKLSLNQWYAGAHWTKRKAIKDNYKLIIKNQYKHVFPKTNIYYVDYKFNFKSKPLDASNCIAMIKLIEDIIFEDDKYDIVKNISISSNKGKKDSVSIRVLETNELLENPPFL